MFIPCGEIEIEAALAAASPEKAVIISHPHPLYGGNMENSVVLTVERAFVEKGWSSLRFNFRGAGRSSGCFDDGKGEIQDLAAVVSYMRKQGFATLTLVGYSFGSCINAMAVSNGLVVENHIMISPPVDFMDFQPVTSLPFTGLVVAGDCDEFGSVNRIRHLLKTCQSDAGVEVIEGADHFYSGQLDTLYHLLKNYIA